MSELKEELLDRRIKSIYMEPVWANGVLSVKKTNIAFVDAVDVEPAAGEEKSRAKSTEYTAKSGHTPHKDFSDAMRDLLYHALKVAEMNVNKADLDDYAVIGIKLDGDLFMNQARVSIIMAHLVHRTENIMKLPPTPQTTLGDGSKYLEWKDLQKKVKILVEEAWEFFKGKHFDDETPLAFQLTLDLTPKKKESKKPSRKRQTQPEPEVEETNGRTINMPPHPGSVDSTIAAQAG